MTNTTTTTTTTTTELSSPMVPLADPSLSNVDAITIFAPPSTAAEETGDIFDQISQTIFFGEVDDDGDAPQEHLQINPTPIGSYGQIVVVPELSVQNDSSLFFDSDVASDILDLLRVPLLSDLQQNTKKHYDDAVWNSSNKNRRCDYHGTLQSSSYRRPHSFTSSSSSSSSIGFFAAEPAAKKLKKSPKVKEQQQQQQISTPDKKCKKGPKTHHRQKNKWNMRLQELLDFKQIHGHCRVPNVYPENSSLAQWVKRHRHQHTLKTEGKHSTLSDERQKILDSVGFVWDAHECLWMERWNELQTFFVAHGHSNVPTNYPSNRHLSIWVKCQRRQYKLYQTGGQSNMTEERVRKLESLEFIWNPRGF